MGAGLYANEKGRWTMIGIMSRRYQVYPSENSMISFVFVFTSVPSYAEWITKAKNYNNERHQEFSNQMDARSIRTFIGIVGIPTDYSLP